MRFLLYSPDSFGLGHIRRNLAIAEHLVRAFPGCRIRLLTGSPRAHLFDLPQGCDYVALPGVGKNAAGEYIAADSSATLEEVLERRTRLVEHTIDAFKPDLFLVDHAPLGLGGELRRPLEAIRRTQSMRVVLGLRDVIDSPDRVRAAWKRSGMVDVLESYFDSILVYGDVEVFDLAAEYGLPETVRRKVRQVGYIAKTARESRTTVRELLAPQTDQLVLVTVGGGGDGSQLLRSFLAAQGSLESAPAYESLCVTGPLMDPVERREFKNWIGRLPRVNHLDETPALFEVIRAADFVVSMGGYNTVYELAAAGVNALIVPRCHPRHEQDTRAARLEALGLVQVLPIENASGSRLLEAVDSGLRRKPAAPGWGLRFNALDQLAQEFRRQLRPTVSASLTGRLESATGSSLRSKS